MTQDIAVIERAVQNKPAYSPDIVTYFSDSLSGHSRLFVGAAHNIQAQLDNVETLSEKLPPDDARTKQLEDIKDRLQKIQLDPRWAGLLALRIESVLVPSGTPKESEATKNWLTHVTDQLASLTEESNAFGENILKTAEQMRKENERRYATFTWVSYALYTLGWSLGLVGHIFELKDIEVP